jgi:hypothetical protein
MDYNACIKLPLIGANKSKTMDYNAHIKLPLTGAIS